MNDEIIPAQLSIKERLNKSLEALSGFGKEMDAFLNKAQTVLGDMNTNNGFTGLERFNNIVNIVNNRFYEEFHYIWSQLYGLSFILHPSTHALVSKSSLTSSELLKNIVELLYNDSDDSFELRVDIIALLKSDETESSKALVSKVIAFVENNELSWQHTQKMSAFLTKAQEALDNITEKLIHDGQLQDVLNGSNTLDTKYNAIITQLTEFTTKLDTLNTEVASAPSQINLK